MARAARKSKEHESNGNGHDAELAPSDGPNQLRAAIGAKGWTQLRAAAEIGVSTTTMSRWLSRKRVPDREHMKALRELFGIGPEIWV